MYAIRSYYGRSARRTVPRKRRPAAPATSIDRKIVADKLFATLDTTVRTLQPELRPRVLVSDTVGFLRDLP